MAESIVFINGRFLPEESAVVSVFDRGFLYGDGLFETLRLYNGLPFRWNQHWDRLSKGAGLLMLRLPFSTTELRTAVDELVRRTGQRNSILRLVLTRGKGPRGYSTQGCMEPTLVMSLHELPPAATSPPIGWRLHTSSVRMSGLHPLANMKTCNRLPQILARAEAEAAGADEALLLDSGGRVAEGSASNVFCVEGDAVVTPPLTQGVLDGVTRRIVVELCLHQGFGVVERHITSPQLQAAEGVFLTLSSVGIIAAVSLDGNDLRRSSLVSTLQQKYAALVRREMHA